MDNKLQVIAYYLPQFHAIPENDEWWGKGFTEWVNVKKAKPLFKGHKQPNVPAPELGYYNLLDDEVRRKQTALAKEAGIDGFCYWHYWFGNGVELLEKPFQMMLADKSNRHGFCLGWANETWKRKQWRKDGSGDVNLAEQVYPGEEDDEAHFYAFLDAFKDDRYMRYEDKPIFLIYRPKQHPRLQQFIELWNELAIKNGFENGFCFLADLGAKFSKEDIVSLKQKGITFCTMTRKDIGQAPLLYRAWYVMKNFFLRRPERVINYSSYIKWAYTKKDSELGIIPSICPTWDHSPRSGQKCTILHESTPSLFAKHVENTLELCSFNEEIPFIFIKSWNEWGEGNFMEPDAIYGKDRITALRKAIGNKKIL